LNCSAPLMVAERNAPHRVLSALRPPDRVRGPRGKGWFHKEPDQKRPAPAGKRARTKERSIMNTYEIVTDKIISLLEQGVIPWCRPWTATGLPHNLISKKPYRGVNLFLLSGTKYVSPYWLTMRQANELGGQVRKGEHSQIVVFWKVDQIGNAKSETDPQDGEADEKRRRRFVLRYYRIFNVEQCELPQTVLDKMLKIETHQHDPIEAAERIIAGMPNTTESG